MVSTLANYFLVFWNLPLHEEKRSIIASRPTVGYRRDRRQDPWGIKHAVVHGGSYGGTRLFWSACISFVSMICGKHRRRCSIVCVALDLRDRFVATGPDV